MAKTKAFICIVVRSLSSVDVFIIILISFPGDRATPLPSLAARPGRAQAPGTSLPASSKRLYAMKNITIECDTLFVCPPAFVIVPLYDAMILLVTLLESEDEMMDEC